MDRTLISLLPESGRRWAWQKDNAFGASGESVCLRPVIIDTGFALHIPITDAFWVCIGRPPHNLPFHLDSFIGVDVFRLDYYSVTDEYQIARGSARIHCWNKIFSDLITSPIKCGAGCFGHNSPAGQRNFLK